MAYRRTKLSLRKADKLVSYFVAEVTARSAAELTGVSKDTAALFYRKTRTVTAAKLLESSIPAISLKPSDVGSVKQEFSNYLGQPLKINIEGMGLLGRR